MSTLELDTLILENWADLDAVGSRASDIEDEIFEAVNQKVEDWCSTRGWSGVFKAPNNLWISPQPWTTTPGRRPAADAWWELNHINADADWWSLTTLIGATESRMAFRLKQLRLGKSQWNALIQVPANSARLPNFRARSRKIESLGISVRGRVRFKWLARRRLA